MAIRCPLPLAPIPVPKVWGGDRLHDFVEGEQGASWADPVGEVWLLCDREDRSSTVASGPFEGRSLRGLMLSESDALLGAAMPAPGGTFPLLLKLLDARKNLSVQVHPDAEAAHALGSEAKHECWYVLAADEGAEVLLGLAKGIGPRQFAAGVDSPDIVDLMERFPVRTGDRIEVPAGTVHAICAGVAIVEVQSNSDTTYRIYDWDREVDGTQRPLHLEEALRCIDYKRRPSTPAPPEYRPWPALGGAGAVNRRALLSSSERFVAERLDLHGPAEISQPDAPTALLVLSGRGRLLLEDGETHGLERGQTWLLPADLGSARVVDADGELSVLRALPQFQGDAQSGDVARPRKGRGN